MYILRNKVSSNDIFWSVFSSAEIISSCLLFAPVIVIIIFFLETFVNWTLIIITLCIYIGIRKVYLFERYKEKALVMMQWCKQNFLLLLLIFFSIDCFKLRNLYNTMITYKKKGNSSLTVEKFSCIKKHHLCHIRNCHCLKYIHFLLMLLQLKSIVFMKWI